MATKRRPYDELKSKRRRVNDMLRQVVGCPLCFANGPRRWPQMFDEEGEVVALLVVKWRARGVRLACPYCGLRFTLDIDTLDGALDRSGAWSPSDLDR